MRERARDPELEYIFKHALTQEAAYDLLLLKRRRELHRRAGEVLERLYVGRTDELAPVLAHHFWLGEDWARAAEYALRAGARARAVYALREALEHYQRARAALDKLPDAPPEQVYNAILGWTFVAYRLGLHDQLLEPLQRAEAIARQLGDTARLAEALAWIGNAHLLAGFPSRAVPVLRESSQLASALGDERLSLLPLFMVSITQMDRDPRAALTQMDQVLELARKYQVPDIEAHELALKGAAHARLGEFERAQQAIEAALAMLPRLNSAVKQADVYIGVGMAYIDMGEVQRGVEYTRRGAEISLDAKGLDCACAGYVYTGVGDLRLPDLPSAQEALEQAASLGEQLEGFESSPLAAMAHGALARVRFASGRVEAVDDMHAALENARTLGDEYTAAVTAQALGEAYARLSNDQRAEQHLSTALSYYRRHELRPYLVGALQSLADVYEQQGRTAEALQARSEAEALAQELGRSAPAPSPATLG